MKYKAFGKNNRITLVIVFCVIALLIVFFVISSIVPADADYVADDFSYVVVGGEKYYGVRAPLLDDPDISTARYMNIGSGHLYLESEVGKPTLLPYKYDCRCVMVANGINAVEVCDDEGAHYLYCAEKDIAALRDFLKSEPEFSRCAAFIPSYRHGVTTDEYIALSDELTEFVASVEPLTQKLYVDGSALTSRSYGSIRMYMLDETYTFKKHVASVATLDDVIYLLPEYGDYGAWVYLDGKVADNFPCNATLSDIEKYKLPEALSDEITKMKDIEKNQENNR